MDTHLTYLNTQAGTLLRLLRRAAQATTTHTTLEQRRHLVQTWLGDMDRFGPAAALRDSGDGNAARQIEEMCRNGDYSPSIWRLAHTQSEQSNPAGPLGSRQLGHARR